jgi:hypothetical protein
VNPDDLTDADLEGSILGGLVVEPTFAHHVFADLEPQAFLHRGHAFVFGALFMLHQSRMLHRELDLERARAGKPPWIVPAFLETMRTHYAHAGDPWAHLEHLASYIDNTLGYSSTEVEVLREHHHRRELVTSLSIAAHELHEGEALEPIAHDIRTKLDRYAR